MSEGDANLEDAMGRIMESLDSGEHMRKVRERAESPDAAAMATFNSLRKVIHDFMAEFKQEELGRDLAWNVITIGVVIDNAIAVLQRGPDEDVLSELVGRIRTGETIDLEGGRQAVAMTPETLTSFMRAIGEGKTPEEAFAEVGITPPPPMHGDEDQEEE